MFFHPFIAHQVGQLIGAIVAKADHHLAAQAAEKGLAGDNGRLAGDHQLTQQAGVGHVDSMDARH
ncbi:hypothetical protein D3C71_2026870 [compost metagenome]